MSLSASDRLCYPSAYFPDPYCLLGLTKARVPLGPPRSAFPGLSSAPISRTFADFPRLRLLFSDKVR